jgi:hypothetical protein
VFNSINSIALCSLILTSNVLRGSWWLNRWPRNYQRCISDHRGLLRKTKRSQMNPVYTLACLIVEIRFNAYSYHLLLCLPSGLFVPSFLTTVYEARIWHMRAKCTAHPLLFELVVVLQYTVKSKCKLWNSSLCLLSCRVRFHFFLFRSRNFLSTTHARAIYSSHRMVDQVPQPSNFGIFHLWIQHLRQFYVRSVYVVINEAIIG